VNAIKNQVRVLTGALNLKAISPCLGCWPGQQYQLHPSKWYYIKKGK
jgi:hypothetical protein